MAISVNHATRVIFIPQSFLTLISGSLYQLDVNALRLALKDWEDGEDGMFMPDTHRHNTQVVLSGVTYARTFEIINGYTVEFENGNYTVSCSGGNHNLGDVKVVNSVSLIIGNSAGLISVTSGSGLDAGQDAKLTNIYAQLTAIEANYDHNELMRLMAAVLLGKVSGAGSGTETFRDVNDTVNRVVSVNDAEGNRTGVTLTP